MFNMPLVDYGSSDESEAEENEKIENVTEDKPTSEVKNEADYKNSKVPLSDGSDLENKLFSMLPSPKTTFSIPDNTFKLLNKKQPVKIVLPSLDEINKSLNGDEVKKPKPSTKESGLFALLPAPKNSKSLIPDSVKKSTTAIRTIAKKPLTPRVVKKPLPSVSKTVNKEYEEDDDCSDKPESFFFSSSDVKPEEIEPVDMPELKENVAKSLFDEFDAPENNLLESRYTENNIHPAAASSISVEQNMEVGNINQEALEKLCGAGASKRKADMPEEIIDINVNSVVGDAYLMLSRDLTTEHGHNSFKKPKNLSVVERRKHQITYLASQAKEKELELRNQWANSRMTRKQTQSKYGF